MTKKVYVAIIVILSLLCIVLAIWNYKLRSVQTPDPQIIEKIDSVDRIIDSIRTVNDTIYIKVKNYKDKIIYIDKEYEKAVNIVLTQPVDSDCEFFSKYISENSKRFVGSIDTSAIKDN